MQYWKLALALVVVGGAATADAVEKTAIDKRMNPSLDLDLQALQTFIGTLTGRLERDLAGQITILNGQLNAYQDLVNRLDARIVGVRANYTACPHAVVSVPSSGSYDTATNRLFWTGNTWTTQPTQPWEHQ